VATFESTFLLYGSRQSVSRRYIPGSQDKESGNSKYSKLDSGGVATAERLYRFFSVIHKTDVKTGDVRLM